MGPCDASCQAGTQTDRRPDTDPPIRSDTLGLHRLLWHRNKLGVVLCCLMLSITSPVSSGLVGAVQPLNHGSAATKAAPSFRLRGRGREITCDRSRSENLVLLERPEFRRGQQEAARDSSACPKSLKWQETEQDDISHYNKVCRS